MKWNRKPHNTKDLPPDDNEVIGAVLTGAILFIICSDPEGFRNVVNAMDLTIKAAEAEHVEGLA